MKKAGADAAGDVGKAKFEDSNIANYGSKEHVAARKGAAETEPEFKGAGQKVGLEIWRVENRRSKDDTPIFGVKRWPKADYGTFYSGDSFLVLNTYKAKMKNGSGKEVEKLCWDAHFWIGKESTQDEYGVAAYKTVELDDLLDDGPVQHREVQGKESQLFKSYFPRGMKLLDGGIASGFREVKPTEYKPRLFQVRTLEATKETVCFQIPLLARSMNEGDCFILDNGLTFYTYIGSKASPFEKSRCAALAANMRSGRGGLAKLAPAVDETFWKVLGGKPSDVLPPQAKDPNLFQITTPDKSNVKLFKLSDASGTMTFTKVAEGTVRASMLDSNDVFILDAGPIMFVWIGSRASQSEKSHAMKRATEYLKSESKPDTTPITRILEGQVDFVFSEIIGGASKTRTPLLLPKAIAELPGVSILTQLCVVM